MTVTRKSDGLMLIVVDVAELGDGRPAYVVCKVGAGQMGRFKIAQDAVEPAFK